MIKEGIIVRTSYGTGPYKILEVKHGCTCPSFIDAINLGSAATASKPHCHCICRSLNEPDKRKHFYLNGYDENLNSVWDSDRLVNIEEETLFLQMCCNL